MAEEKYHDLSTDTKRVDYFNQQVQEFKESNPEVAEASPGAFDIARRYAQQSIFPPFGLISFPEDPKNLLGDEGKIKEAAERVIFGSSRFISSLKKDSPMDLMNKGIDTYKGFDDSAAVNELTGATRISFATVKGGLHEIQSAIKADDKDSENPFEKNPILSKLDPNEIESLLDSTVLKVIKELGLKRIDEANDKLILDKGESSFIKAKELAATSNIAITKALESSKLNTKEDPEYMARLEKSRKEDELIDSLDLNRAGAKITPLEGKKVDTKPEGIKVTETPLSTPPQNTTFSSAIDELKNLRGNVTANITNNSTSVFQDPDAKPRAIFKSETPVKAPDVNERNTATSAVKQEANPASTSPSVEPTKTSNQPKILAKKSLISDDETPLLKMLGESIGMKPDDIAKMFAGKEDNLQKSLDLTFPGEIPVIGSQIASTAPQETATVSSLSTAATQPQKTVEQSTTISTANKISEPVKIAEKAPELTKQETSKVTPTPETIQTTTESASTEISGGGNNETPKPETKPQSDTTNKEEGSNNDELLRVMKEVLKTLQGPLIVTESTPKFS